MIKLKDYLHSILVAKDNLREANEELETALKPVLKELGIDITHKSLSNVFVEGGMVYATVNGSRRGYEYSDDCGWPLSIFEAEDSVAAAKAFVQQEKNIKTSLERNAKLLQLEKLQTELGIK